MGALAAMTSGSILKAASGDPRRPNEVKKYNRPVVNMDTQPPDFMLLVGMIFGMVALLVKVKAAGWVSIVCCVSALANMKSEAMDLKQIVSAVTFGIMGLISSYLSPTLHGPRSSG